ncbi:1-aminocyclopropane-1-carboxylate deaminase/D-cysteine desulfhydrase [Sphingobacterium bovistauri]|uniref:Pyridoxal-phosphate dependent enzyme n=1 Tax=Sphingobacterium bovistauri TaxID=2781959 RepID=A0ABS7Z079_9SPHI|nr:pyridoxal-phosphate dependent enzyme [Sphingobacterium bovistauri]MCA5003575.1 pyridoxal-phosphate dependent enzyme [Sphingobacterium bovistauri]
MHIYSPEQKIEHPLYSLKNLEVYLKRDDMIHPFISGNKWRKLKYNLERAKRENKSIIVTFGGAWSNHLLATACAGATYQYKTISFVRGEDISNPVLDMCKLFGMELRFISREEYKDKNLLFENLENKTECFFIDEGGASLEATYGCKELIDELTNKYDHIFCAAGTGTTVAGISQGIADSELKTQLHVVPVLKNGGFILDEIAKYNAPTDQITLHLDYHFGGYAKVKPELIDFIKNYIQATGVMIEPTYTGKAMYALHDLIQKDVFAVGSKILFVNTGGLTGLLGQLGKFD